MKMSYSMHSSHPSYHQEYTVLDPLLNHRNTSLSCTNHLMNPNSMNNYPIDYSRDDPYVHQDHSNSINHHHGLVAGDPQNDCLQYSNGSHSPHHYTNAQNNSPLSPLSSISNQTYPETLNHFGGSAENHGEIYNTCVSAISSPRSIPSHQQQQSLQTLNDASSSLSLTRTSSKSYWQQCTSMSSHSSSVPANHCYPLNNANIFNQSNKIGANVTNDYQLNHINNWSPNLMNTPSNTPSPISTIGSSTNTHPLDASTSNFTTQQQSDLPRKSFDTAQMISGHHQISNKNSYSDEVGSNKNNANNNPLQSLQKMVQIESPPFESDSLHMMITQESPPDSSHSSSAVNQDGLIETNGILTNNQYPTYYNLDHSCITPQSIYPSSSSSTSSTLSSNLSAQHSSIQPNNFEQSLSMKNSQSSPCSRSQSSIAKPRKLSNSRLADDLSGNTDTRESNLINDADSFKNAARFSSRKNFNKNNSCRANTTASGSKSSSARAMPIKNIKSLLLDSSMTSSSDRTKESFRLFETSSNSKESTEDIVGRPKHNQSWKMISNNSSTDDYHTIDSNQSHQQLKSRWQDDHHHRPPGTTSTNQSFHQQQSMSDGYAHNSNGYNPIYSACCNQSQSQLSSFSCSSNWSSQSSCPSSSYHLKMSHKMHNQNRSELEMNSVRLNDPSHRNHQMNYVVQESSPSSASINGVIECVKKKRGRPFGSKNRRSLENATASGPTVQSSPVDQIKKKRRCSLIDVGINTNLSFDAKADWEKDSYGDNCRCSKMNIKSLEDKRCKNYGPVIRIEKTLDDINHTVETPNSSKHDLRKNFDDFLSEKFRSDRSIFETNVKRKNGKKLIIANHQNHHKKYQKILSNDLSHSDADDNSITANRNDRDWCCILCHKGPNYRGLGNLYGPYYISIDKFDFTLNPDSELKEEIEIGQGFARNIKKENDCDDGTVFETKQTITNSSMERRFSSRKKSISAESNLQHQSNGDKILNKSSKESLRKLFRLNNKNELEVWVHEDCIVWSNNVYLEGTKIRNLEPAIIESFENICTKCKLPGATLGCIYKNCNVSPLHYLCAKDKDCDLDEEKFILSCSEHQKRRIVLKENNELLLRNSTISKTQKMTPTASASSTNRSTETLVSNESNADETVEQPS
ncbi:protein disulfide isomerase [Sarcoptes scabiei]|nr:protein disulfide isomerase [Sarcoptes scabiei]